MPAEEFDIINKAKHYNSHPSGVECHTIAYPFGYYIGNAVKYLWRCGLKDDGQQGIQDLKKAIWYIETEIKRREAAKLKWEGSDSSSFTNGKLDEPQPTAKDLHPF